MRARGHRRHHRGHQSDGGARARRRQRPVCGDDAPHGAARGLAKCRFLPRQARRAGGAASPFRRHRLSAGTEHQGEPGRAARHPDDRLGDQAPLRRPLVGRTAASRLSGTGRVRGADGRRALPVASALCPAPAQRPQGRPPAVRLPEDPGPAVRPRGRAGQSGGRGLHAALLSHHHRAGAPQRDAAAALRRGDPARRRTCRGGAGQCPLPGAQRLSRDP